MTPETERTLITVTGTVSATVVGVIAGVWGTIIREKWLSRRSAVEKHHIDRREALNGVLTGLYAMDIAMQKCNLKRVLSKELEENRKRRVAELGEQLVKPDVEERLKALISEKMVSLNALSEKGGDLQIDSFSDRIVFLERLQDVLVASVMYGEYRAEWRIAGSLARHMESHMYEITKATNWNAGSPHKGRLYDLIDDVWRLIGAEDVAVFQARRGDNIEPSAPKLSILPVPPVDSEEVATPANDAGVRAGID